MIKASALSTVLLSSNILIAQEQQAASPQPSDTSAWKHQAMIGASVTQVSFTDWTQGGEKCARIWALPQRKIHLFDPEARLGKQLQIRIRAGKAWLAEHSKNG
jgi:hypothetical protein